MATGQVESGLTIDELILAYLTFADGYYLKNGVPTDEPANIKYALRPLRRGYGQSEARRFSPLGLKAVRESMIESSLCRNEVNKRIGKIVRMFHRAAENELVPGSVYQDLKAVRGLSRGRTTARESALVRPVADAHVDAVRAHVSRQAWAMVELQRLTGMRPGEVCMMATGDIERSGSVWAYRPSSHKTEHHGRERVVPLGPRAQDVLRSWLRGDPAAYLFSPAEAMKELHSPRRAIRKTSVQPSQLDRQKRDPIKTPGAFYTTDSYRRAIQAGCLKADVTPWHPHQLRHNAATALRRDFGIDAARIIFGHSSPATTAIYAEEDREKATRIMGQVG